MQEYNFLSQNEPILINKDKFLSDYDHKQEHKVEDQTLSFQSIKGYLCRFELYQFFLTDPLCFRSILCLFLDMKMMA